MVLATTTFEDYERFMAVFTTMGAEKRKEHGSRGRARLPRPQSRPTGSGSVFDWDEERLAELRVRPFEVPPIMQQAGHKGRPQTASFDVHLDA